MQERETAAVRRKNDPLAIFAAIAFAVSVLLIGYLVFFAGGAGGEPRCRPGAGLGPRGGEGDIDRAVEAARDASGNWAAMSPAGRRSLLHAAASRIDEHRDEIARLLKRLDSARESHELDRLAAGHGG
jgi:hypothetical protein